MMQVMRGELIVFLGPVGVGKSTHAILLCRVLRKRGSKVFGKFTIKTHHLPGYALERFFVRVALRGLNSKYVKYTPIRVLFENKPHLFHRIFKLWYIIDFISMLLTFSTITVLPLRLGYVVVIEEGLLATLADYLWLSRLAGIDWKEKLLRIPFRILLTLCFAYRPSFVIYLDAEFGVLQERWRLRGTPEERYDYVLMQKKLLRALCKKFYCCYIIDTTNNIVLETAKQILHLIKQHCST